MSPSGRETRSYNHLPVPGDQGEKEHPPRARYWPLPGVTRRFPAAGGAGSFWEDRGDRRHAGIDLYAPPGSRVVSIEDGTVISAGIFTSPDFVPYWNKTYQVTIAHVAGFFCRYAELGDLTVKTGASLRGGRVVGHVGEVLNLARIGAGSPPYIRALKEEGGAGMLHIEVFTSVPGENPLYMGGNWFSCERPDGLLDPVLILRDAV